MSTARTVIISVIITIVLIIVIALVSLSLERLEFDEVGVSYDVTGRKVEDNVEYAGLHSGVPGFTFIKFPAVFKSIHFERLKCFTYDGAEVSLDVQYQFKIFDKEIPNLLQKFRDYEKYLDMLKLVGKSQFYKSCSHFSAYDIVADRVQFANVSQTLLKERYLHLHALINGLQINNIGRPGEYNEAQQKKETVRENIQVKLKERPEKLTVAETEKEKAIAKAKIQIQVAETKARTILTVASNKAAVIRKQAQVDSEIYLKLLQTEVGDLSSYLAVEAFSSAQKPVRMNLHAP